MADYAAPSGPPPPKVPEGWKAVWNDQYKEWFYVNTHTKASQWDKPTEPVYAAPSGGPPPGAPPGYDHSQSKPTGPEKGGLGSNNPYNGAGPGAGQSSLSADEELARKLQAEEEQRARSSGGTANRGASDSYYQGGGSYPQQSGPYGGQSSPYGQQQSPGPADQTKSKGGFFSKITNKLGGGSSSRPGQYNQGYPQQSYGGAPGYGQQQYAPQYGGAYPPQQGYGNYGPPQGQYYQQQPQRRQGGGLGAGGGALLGAGAGLVGGALLMDAIDDHDQEAYQEGYQDGGGGDDYGGDDGGDF